MSMCRHVDPDFALQSRLSFGRGARYAWALTAAALFLGFNGVELDTPPAVAFDRAGSFLLLAALPYGAIQIRALERNGHLDARRLTGRSPAALGLALIGGSAGALLFAGVTLLLAGWVGGQALPVFTVTAILALGIALALVLLLLPASTHVDSWILLVLLFMGVVSTVHVMRDDRGVALGVVIVSALILPWALPMALRRMRGAPDQPAGPSHSLLRRLTNLHRTAHGEFARGVLSADTSLPAAAVMAVAGALVLRWLARTWQPGPREALEGLVVYAPLVLAGYDTATWIQRERVSGGLDRIRLSGQAPWRVALEFAAAFSLPFALVSLFCAAALTVIDPGNAAVLLPAWPFVAFMLIAAPLAGALRGRTPGLYLAGAIALVALTMPDSQAGLTRLFAAAVIAMVVAGGLERDDQAPLRGWWAVAGTALISATATALCWRQWTGPLVAGILAVSSGLLMPDRGQDRSRTLAACAIAAAVAAGLATHFWVEDWTGARFSLRVRLIPMLSGDFMVVPIIGPRGVYSPLVAAYAGVGLLYGCLVHNRFGRTVIRSLVWRAIPVAVVGALIAVSQTWTVYESMYEFAKRTRYNWIAVAELVLLGCLIGAVGILLWRDRKALQRG